MVEDKRIERMRFGLNEVTEFFPDGGKRVTHYGGVGIGPVPSTTITHSADGKKIKIESNGNVGIGGNDVDK